MTLLATPIGMMLVFALTLLGLYGLYAALDPTQGQGKNIQKRLKTLGQKKSPAATKRAASAVDITGVRNRGMIDHIFGHFLPNPEKLRQRLARTGRPITMGQYLLWNIITAILGGAACLIWLKLSPAASFFCGLILGMWLPHKYVARLIGKRNKLFLGQFPDAIDLVVRGVRSGLPIGESIKTIAKEMPKPIADEFSIVNDSMKLGQPIEKALWECSDRLDLPEVKFFVIALSIQRETGGNLAETLENLSGILRKRRFMQMKIKAMSSEARASAMIIGSLPFIMFGILMMLNPKYVGVLISDPRGNTLVAIGLSLIFVGNFIMRKLAGFKI